MKKHIYYDVKNTIYHNPHPKTDASLGTIKLRIPPFLGKNVHDAYMEWERKMELVFECQNYTEEKKLKLAVTEFSGYAVKWWGTDYAQDKAHWNGTSKFMVCDEG